jgi:hypothetical protein
MGTDVRVARLPTAQTASAPVEDRWRLLTPLSVQIGYRHNLRAWGLDAFGRLSLGTESTGIRKNDAGGHIDYAASGLLGLHFLHYSNGASINSFYFGTGATLELAFFQAVRPLSDRASGSRETMAGGGLNVDFLIGYEFLRTSWVHFFAQAELDIPTYALKRDNDAGSLNAYMPGALAQIGVIF